VRAWRPRPPSRRASPACSCSSCSCLLDARGTSPRALPVRRRPVCGRLSTAHAIGVPIARELRSIATAH
jgi:hypothetical protein